MKTRVLFEFWVYSAVRVFHHNSKHIYSWFSDAFVGECLDGSNRQNKHYCGHVSSYIINAKILLLFHYTYVRSVQATEICQLLRLSKSYMNKMQIMDWSKFYAFCVDYIIFNKMFKQNLALPIMFFWLKNIK